MSRAILLISCPDHRGITATLTDFIYKHNGNIEHADQHIDEQNNIFFMRIEWSLDGFDIEQKDITQALEPFADQFDMHWELYFEDELTRVAIFVSKPMHCLYDLLYRHKAGHLRCEIPLIISNHSDAKELADIFNIRFVKIPKENDNKFEQEENELAILKEANINLIILARYHQIFTKNFVEQYPNKIINIHHSFLPAFAGQNPYTQAYDKGVKIIGATSHYVIEQLDEGPIIEQSTVRISHRDSIEGLKRKGEDLEKVVLYRAVYWHLEHKILCYNNKTVVFD